MKRLLLLLALPLLATLTACHARKAPQKPDPLRNAYGTEPDWNNPDHLIPLDYQQSQGQRLFYVYCVWCHADSTPAGPSNRYNLTPVPSQINNGKVLNALSNGYLDNVITLGGSAMGKSSMMPPYGRTLSQKEIKSVIAFIRAVADPPYHPPARAGSRYSEK